jgi:hypothetical protein
MVDSGPTPRSRPRPSTGGFRNLVTRRRGLKGVGKCLVNSYERSTGNKTLCYTGNSNPISVTGWESNGQALVTCNTPGDSTSREL